MRPFRDVVHRHNDGCQGAAPQGGSGAKLRGRASPLSAISSGRPIERCALTQEGNENDSLRPWLHDAGKRHWGDPAGLIVCDPKRPLHDSQGVSITHPRDRLDQRGRDVRSEGQILRAKGDILLLAALFLSEHGSFRSAANAVMVRTEPAQSAAGIDNRLSSAGMPRRRAQDVPRTARVASARCRCNRRGHRCVLIGMSRNRKIAVRSVVACRYRFG